MRGYRKQLSATNLLNKCKALEKIESCIPTSRKSDVDLKKSHRIEQKQIFKAVEENNALK